MDNANWSYDGEGVDHGDLNGTCDYCGNELRYEHHVSHRNCGSLTVGSQCAENLTRSTEATDRQRFLERRSRFVKSKKWSHVDVATESIKQGKIEAAIVKLDQNGFHLEINGTAGQQSYKTAEDAKKLLFENICNGKIATFFEKAKAA